MPNRILKESICTSESLVGLSAEAEVLFYRLIVKADDFGLKVWLCARHHNMSGEGVHFNTGLDLRLKRIAQRQFEKQYGHEKFMKLFGRNYL